MRKQRSGVNLVSFSVSAYKILITAYPSEFQKAYGPHMLQLFRDCCIRSYDQQGPAGMLSLWAVTLFDFVRSIMVEHSQRETHMTRQLFIRMSGLALILGAIAFTLLLVADSLPDILPSTGRFFRSIEDEVMWVGLFLGPPLIALGMVGLGIRHGSEAGRLGRTLLFVGAACGAGAVPLAFFSEALLSVFTAPGGIWIGTLVALLVAMFLCLALFGIVSLRRKAMPHWNGLPVVVGLWFPAAMLISLLTTDEFWNTALAPTALLFAGAAIMLGYSLLADPAPEPVVAQ